MYALHAGSAAHWVAIELVGVTASHVAPAAVYVPRQLLQLLVLTDPLTQ
jgi:hypothetical protein